MAYSPDFRQCVLNFIDAGNSWTDACETIKVSRGAISIWRQQLATTGSLCSRPHPSVARKLPAKKLQAYLAKHPDAYLREIAPHFGCSRSGVYRALKRLGITHKKNAALP